MKLNCKPGDLAVVVKAPTRTEFLGRVCTVLWAAPAHERFRLPDDYLHDPAGEGRWVVEFASPIKVEVTGGFRVTPFAAVRDECLTPIRDPGEDAVDEILQLVGSPNKVAA